MLFSYLNVGRASRAAGEQEHQKWLREKRSEIYHRFMSSMFAAAGDPNKFVAAVNEMRVDFHLYASLHTWGSADQMVEAAEEFMRVRDSDPQRAEAARVVMYEEAEQLIVRIRAEIAGDRNLIDHVRADIEERRWRRTEQGKKFARAEEDWEARKAEMRAAWNETRARWKRRLSRRQ